MKSSYNTVIIGAGPSGLSTALHLKKGGVDVLVVERFEFPRYKCCAGYITGKTKTAFEKLGLNISDCSYSLIKDFNIVYKFKNRLKIDNKFLYTNRNIDRVELDNAFYELAKSCSVDIEENTKIITHDIQNKTVTLSNGKTVGYKNLVFADGTVGFGSKYQKLKKKNIAMQLTFKSNFKEEIAIHFGVTKRGYGWVSSFCGITNVGLTDVYNAKINYREVFQKFLKSLDISADINELKAAFTPIGTVKPVIGDNIFFVGDAVGACDPLTLSGLRYGLASGEACALAIKVGKASVYKRHIKKLKTKFKLMSALQVVFYLKTSLFCIFNVGCRVFGRFISYVFNNFFVNKK